MQSAYRQANYVVTLASEYVLHIELDRPEKLNAFNDALWASLRTIFDTASHDPEVRVCVLSARGRAFTAGLDITQTSIGSHGKTAGGGEQEQQAQQDVARVGLGLRRHIRDFQDAISSIQRCSKPVICCLHGLTLGLGIDIASACDIRYAAADTRFSIKEVDIGLAADIGSLQRLPYVLGNASWLKEMALTAALFDAPTALHQGLLSKVSPTREQCILDGLDTARLIATKSPVAIQGTKFLLDYSREHTVQEGLQMTEIWNAAMLQSRDVSDAIAGALTKSPAKFSKL